MAFLVFSQGLLACAATEEVELLGAGEGPTLVGTEWSVSSYESGQRDVVELVPGTRATLIFSEDAVTGTAGCNRYQASFVQEGDSVTIGPAAATRRFCAEPEGLMGQEATFLAALESVARLQVVGTDLELLDSNGATAVIAIATTE